MTTLHPHHAEYIAALSSAIESTREALLAVPHPIAWHGQIVAINAAMDELKKAHGLAGSLLAEMERAAAEIDDFIASKP